MDKSCIEKLGKHSCSVDADCRSALYNMYECNICKFCGRDTIPNAGGLAWTPSGIGAIECTTNCGNPVYCDENGKCRYGIERFKINEYYVYSGVLE